MNCRQKKNGLLNQYRLLKLISPIDGKIVDMHENLHSGRWVNQNLPLLNIINITENQVTAFIQEKDLSRISEQNTGYFYPENIEIGSFAVEVAEIETTNVKQMENQYVLHHYGGDIVTRKNNKNQDIPETAVL